MSVVEIPPKAKKSDWVADRRLYLDKDGKAVEADDANRVSLLVAAGASIPLEKAKGLGLVKEVVEPEAIAAKAKPEAKPEAEAAKPRLRKVDKPE